MDSINTIFSAVFDAPNHFG